MLDLHSHAIRQSNYSWCVKIIICGQLGIRCLCCCCLNKASIQSINSFMQTDIVDFINAHMQLKETLFIIIIHLYKAHLFTVKVVDKTLDISLHWSTVLCQQSTVDCDSCYLILCGSSVSVSMDYCHMYNMT